jgi:flagellar hook protein FlgE
MAISGQGFFSVSEQDGVSTAGQPQFSNQQYFTRAGDFTRSSSGYLVNSAGEYLNGWPVNTADGSVDTSKLVPIQVNQTQYTPVPTTTVSLVANVPATPSATSNLSSETEIYDAAGDSHQLQTSWAQTSTDNWLLTLSSPDNVAGGSTTIGTVAVTFNANGTLGSLGATTGEATVTGSASTGAVQISPDFGNGAQPITIGLGTFGSADGVTQFAGTNYALTSAVQDGAAPGSFTGISADSDGNIQADYDNGRTVTIAQVPLITFQNADALQRQNGEAYTATQQSGAPATQHLNQNGAGGLVIGSTESSNVDIASQLSALIVAQQAYGANAKVITAANELLTTTLNIKQ